MDQARAEGGGGERHRLGAEGVHRIEFLPTALEQNPDQIDHNIGVARRRLDRCRVAQIGLHRMDLADLSQRLQVAGELGPAHRDADAIAALGKRAHHMPAEEAGTAEDGDKAFERSGRHARARVPWRAEYKIDCAVYRASLRAFDKPDGAPYLVLFPRSPQSPGGGIGRRTSFRY